MTKTTIIGVDGMPWKVVIHLAKSGVMPNTAKLINRSYNSTLLSTPDPSSAPAWTSFSTGVNPGKHGIFGFIKRESDTTDFYKPGDTRQPGIHEILSFLSRTVVVINLPLSAPFRLLKGIGIADWLAPEPYVKPENLKSETHGYVFPRIGPAWQTVASHNPGLFLESLRRELSARLNVIKKLYLEKVWDDFIVVFSEPDWLMHKFFLDIFNENSKNRPHIAKIFGLIDDFIGVALANSSPEDMLAVLSDHGFDYFERTIDTNSLLYAWGLQKRRIGKSQDALHTRRLELPRILHQVSTSLPFRRKRTSMLSHVAKRELAWREVVDFESSVAYTHSDTHYKVYVKDKRLNSAVLRRLAEATDPKTGKHYFGEVKHATDVYWGAATGGAGDIFVSPNYADGYGSSRFGHSPQGVLILHSQAVLHRSLTTPASLYDVLPTVLAYLGLPLPSYSDGRVLTEAFKGSNVDADDLQFSNYEKLTRLLAREDDVSLSPIREDKTRDRLIGIGYL